MARQPIVARLARTLLAAAFVSAAATVGAQSDATLLPDHETLRAALTAVVAEENGGFGLPMWAVIVDRDGVVHAVAHSGAERGDQFPAGRLIAAQKAYASNALSLGGLALSTANLYAGTQPGGTLHGLNHGAPLDTATAYRGPAERFGTASDPLVGERVGGMIAFGGGIALYAPDGRILGAVGLSGDSACADHIIAWKLRHALALDYVPGGVSTTGDDNIVHDMGDGASAGGWGHPHCSEAATEIARDLPNTHPIRKD
jgi:uncharacterized protein GlcG (DUF336 family)